MAFKKLKLSPFDELIVSGSHYTLIPINGVLEHLGTEIVHNLSLNRTEFFYTLKGCVIETDAEVAYVTQGNMAKIWDLVELIVDHQEKSKIKGEKCTNPEQTISQNVEHQNLHIKNDIEQKFDEKTNQIKESSAEPVPVKKSDMDKSSPSNLNKGSTTENAPISNENVDYPGNTSTFCYKISGNGRTTLCQTLCNILTRLNRKVLVIELDPAQGHLCFPGTLGLKKMNVPLISEDHGNSLLYFYGNDKIENVEYFQCIREKILDNRIKLHENSSERMIEVFLDDQSDKFDDIENIFHIVVGDETLFHQINTEHKFFVPCHRYEKKDKQFKISEYFYGQAERQQEGGSKKNQNTTFSVLTQSFTPIIMKKTLKIHQIGEQFLPPMSALPIGHDRKTNNLMIRAIRPEQNGIIAISYGKNERELLDQPIKGFLMYMGDDQWLTVQEKINEDSMFLSGNIRISECFD